MLGYDVAATLPELRAQAESLMVDACIIDRLTGQSAPDPTTGVVAPTYGAAFYTGRCRLQDAVTASDSANAGEHEFTVLGRILQLPVDATAYRVGDRVRITASALDPALVGSVLSVRSWKPKSHATMRRLICEEVLA